MHHSHKKKHEPTTLPVTRGLAHPQTKTDTQTQETRLHTRVALARDVEVIAGELGVRREEPLKERKVVVGSLGVVGAVVLIVRSVPTREGRHTNKHSMAQRRQSERVCAVPHRETRRRREPSGCMPAGEPRTSS